MNSAGSWQNADGSTIKMPGMDLARVTEFKHLGSTVWEGGDSGCVR